MHIQATSVPNKLLCHMAGIDKGLQEKGRHMQVGLELLSRLLGLLGRSPLL